MILLVSSSVFASAHYAPINPLKTLEVGEGDWEGVVSQYGVTDGGANIKANGLEWVRWDVTRTLTLEDALAAFPQYRIATGAEVAGLFDHYNLGVTFDGSSISWAGAYEEAQAKREDYVSTSSPNYTEVVEVDYSTSGTRWNFLQDFGINLNLNTPGSIEDSVQAVFKADNESNELGLASATSALGAGGQEWEVAKVEWYKPKSILSKMTGVVLVRSGVPEIDVAAAPISLALLMGLFAINRERRTRAA